MKGTFVSAWSAALLVALAGCSPQYTVEEAEALFKKVHDECAEKSLRSEVLELDLEVPEADYVRLFYFLEEGMSKTMVECVSLELFGQDLTEREFTREELLLYEQKTGRDSSEFDPGFGTVYLDTWDRPFGFVRTDSGSFTSYSFYFLQLPSE